MGCNLLDRTQQVKIGNTFSPPGHPDGGVPQGTLLGPKCFLVYINDLETIVPLYKYVDDSTLFEICHRKSESVLQHSVDVAVRWTVHNDMQINSDKSKEVLISFMQDPEFRNTVPRLTIYGNEINNVQHAKRLGVTIFSDLTWNKHVVNIITKAGKRVYMLYQLKRAGIGQHDLVTIHVSVIRPVLEYACPVWHTNLNRHLTESIETVQKRALNCIYPGYEYADILCLTNLQCLKERRDRLCKRYFQKIMETPHRLNYLLPRQRSNTYGVRTFNKYQLPEIRTNRYGHSLMPCGVFHWH